MKFRFLIVAMLVSLCAFAGERVVDKSGRAPRWVNGLQKDFLIVSGTGSTLEEAKESALLQIKKQVLSSVAERVETESSFSMRESMGDGQSNLRSQFLSEIKTQGANMPFLKEVTLAKASDFYWEKIKKNKTYFYRYHVKYPFDSFELMKLMDTFESREMSINMDMQEFVDEDFSSIKSVEEITQKIAAVRVLQSGLQESDPRYNTCASIISKYSKIYESLVLKLESISREKLVFCIYLGDRRLTTTVKPKLKSNCLSQITYSVDGQRFNVSYLFESCYEDEDNYLEVTFKVGTNKISNKFFVR